MIIEFPPILKDYNGTETPMWKLLADEARQRDWTKTQYYCDRTDGGIVAGYDTDMFWEGSE